MDDGVCIRVWMRDGFPEWVRRAVPLPEEESGVFPEFVAHIPDAVLASRAYRRLNKTGAEGWMREGELGLFGTNACDTYPHPDGDGILVVGSCV